MCISILSLSACLPAATFLIFILVLTSPSIPPFNPSKTLGSPFKLVGVIFTLALGVACFKDIPIKSIHEYEEIILIGSGKGVTSVLKIKELKWKRKNLKMYNRLNNIYKKLN